MLKLKNLKHFIVFISKRLPLAKDWWQSKNRRRQGFIFFSLSLLAISSVSWGINGILKREVNPQVFGFVAPAFDLPWDFPYQDPLFNTTVSSYPFGNLRILQFADEPDNTPLVKWARERGIKTYISLFLRDPRTGSQLLTCDQAAEWVRYYNLEQKLDVEIWEIGNEPHSPAMTRSYWRPYDIDRYEKFYNECYDKMKAADPTIKLALPVPEGGQDVTNPDQPNWTLELLRRLRERVDYLSVHIYPAGGTGNLSRERFLATSQALAKRWFHYKKNVQAGNTGGLIGYLKQATRWLVPNKQIGIIVSEVAVGDDNLGSNYKAEFISALFAASVFLELASQGVEMISWNNHGFGGTNGWFALDNNYYPFPYYIAIAKLYQVIPNPTSLRLVGKGSYFSVSGYTEFSEWGSVTDGIYAGVLEYEDDQGTKIYLNLTKKAFYLPSFKKLNILTDKLTATNFDNHLRWVKKRTNRLPPYSLSIED